MAGYRQPLTLTARAGFALALLLVLAVPAILFELALSQDGSATASLRGFDGYLGGVLTFTLWQAALSALLALAGGVALARALARQTRFPGRRLLGRLLVLPMMMPTLVGLLGLVAAYGGHGWLARLALAAGLPAWPSLYGLGGLLLGHAFFNLPLVALLLLPAFAGQPAQSWQLAAQLGMSGGDVFRVIEWPLLRRHLPGIAVLVFMLCFTSFAVALTLGGGPWATTIEVAIYQALRFDFDLRQAALLSLAQIACCAGLAIVIRRLHRPMPLAYDLHLDAPPRHDGQVSSARIFDFGQIALGGFFLGAPLLALLSEGLVGLLGDYPWSEARHAAALSLGLGLGAGFIALCGGYALASAAVAAEARGWRLAILLLRFAGDLGLFLSPMTLGAAIILTAAGKMDLRAVAPAGILAMNALVALPFAVAICQPGLARIEEAHARLAAALSLRGRQRLRLDWPLLRPILARALALCAALAIGDFSAVAVFGNPDLTPLPLLLYQQLSAYRIQAAGGSALLLLALALALFWSIERAGGKRHGLS